jgi:hypothetical protein
MMRFGRRKPAIVNRADALAARPVRNANLPSRETDAGQVAITLTWERRTDLVGRLSGLLFAVPKKRERTLELDSVGSDVWRLCDGEHTVDDILRMLQAKHKVSRKEAEVSLTTYLKELGKRGVIGFAITQPESRRDVGR